MLKIAEDNHWYREGLSFKCTGCGACCTGTPGYVWVKEQEMQQMADLLQITVSEFVKRYVRKVHGKYCLKEKQPHYDCIFLDGNKCQVYQARPVQCQTYPWWPENLSSEDAWKEAAKRCEGIDSLQIKVSFDEIQKEKQRYEKLVL